MLGLSLDVILDKSTGDYRLRITDGRSLRDIVSNIPFDDVDSLYRFLVYAINDKTYLISKKARDIIKKAYVKVDRKPNAYVFVILNTHNKKIKNNGIPVYDNNDNLIGYLYIIGLNLPPAYKLTKADLLKKINKGLGKVIGHKIKPNKDFNTIYTSITKKVRSKLKFWKTKDTTLYGGINIDIMYNGKIINVNMDNSNGRKYKISFDDGVTFTYDTGNYTIKSSLKKKLLKYAPIAMLAMYILDKLYLRTGFANSVDSTIGSMAAMATPYVDNARIALDGAKDTIVKYATDAWNWIKDKIAGLFG